MARTLPLLGVLLLTPLATAQPETAPQPTRQPRPEGGNAAPGADRRLERLRDDSLDAREQAERELVESAASGVDELLMLLAPGGLDPETHRRVARAAFALFATTPRAGMGVEFDTQRQVERGVPIAKPVENFPAFEIIKPGDVFLSANGVELTDSAQLGRIIVAHDPGDVLEIGVRRDDEELALQVPLGSFSALGQRTRMDHARLISAFELRCAWLGVRDRVVSASVGGGLSIDDWAGAALGPGERPEPDERARPSRRASDDPPVLGGRPRTRPSPEARRPADPRAISPASTPGARSLDLIARRLGELAKQRVALRRQLARDDLPEIDRDRISRSIEDLDARIDEMLRQLGVAQGAEGEAQPSP